MKYMPLGTFLKEYNKRNVGNQYRPVAVGRYGIRKREEIYSKELASDYSKNKIIYKNTLTVGMGSVQIDIGVLTENEIYSVSPAYHTYEINGINPDYLRYCLECRNSDMFNRYVKRGSRQGKTIDLKRWLSYEIPIVDEEIQQEIVEILDFSKNIIEKRKEQLLEFDNLVKSQFIEMFEGKFDTLKIGEVFRTTSGGTPSKSRLEYYKNGTIPWLSSGEVNKGIIYTVKNYITQEGVDNSSAKMVPENSVVIAMYGATAGQVGLLRIPTTTNQAVCSVLPDSRYIPEYLYYAIKSKKDWMISQCAGGAQPNISQGVIKRMEIVNAPYELQKEFAAFVEQTDKSKNVFEMEVAA